MRKLTLACGLALATGFAPGLATYFGSLGSPSARYVALAPAQAAEGDADGGAGAEAGKAEEKVPEAKDAVPVGKEATPDELAEAAYAALEKNCASCHGAGKRLNKAAPVDRASHAKLIEGDSVVPGKPDESPLYTLMFDKEKLMPPARIERRPTDEEKEAIRLWIEKGAPAPKEAKAAAE